MKVDNSKIFYNGQYAEIDIVVPAKTTYKAGTVLGRRSDGKLTAFTTDNNIAAQEEDGETPAVAEFKTQPLYILAQTVTNEETSEAELPMVRVFDGGEVNKNKLIFIKEADASDNNVLDALHTNGFSLENVVDLSEDTCLQE
ncbi:TPA: hypothetical protein IAA87_05855 [Candidatus Avigastranaerophilus faecigallinarum]|nr:hypothetical protein [Candidatus Avigastranaerophilus faecigallinarum]